MREIKFRAWYKGKMINNLNPIETRLENTSECTIMQYTGLKDNNGKEIFEGDIVKHLFHNEQFKVIWNEKGCSFIALYLGGKDRYSEVVKDKLLQVDNVYYEIVGNIYENPELLDNK